MSLYDALKRLAPGVAFTLTQDGTHDNVPYISAWPEDVPMPTQAEIDAMLLTLEQERQAAQTEAQQLRQRVVNLAQSAVGIAVNDLTAPQVRALLALLLRKEGALDKTGTIRPLQDWVR